MHEEPHLDVIYTADEAAARLRLTNRAVIKLGKAHGLCSRQGRNYLFSEADLLALWEVMREPQKESRHTPFKIEVPSFAPKDLSWVFGSPPTKADKRVRGILRWLSTQRSPKSYKQIERAGPNTISQMIADGFVLDCGTNAEGDVVVKIGDGGREQIKKAEKWARAREKHGKPSRWW